MFLTYPLGVCYTLFNYDPTTCFTAARAASSQWIQERDSLEMFDSGNRALGKQVGGMKHYPSHQDELVRLRRIEGQIRGVQKMVEEGRYCVDILRVLSSAQGAIEKVQNQILKKHLNGCVSHAVKSGSEKDRNEKFNEIMELISQFRK